MKKTKIEFTSREIIGLYQILLRLLKEYSDNGLYPPSELQDLIQKVHESHPSKEDLIDKKI